MYRLLEVGEVIENGDEVFGRCHEWFKPVSTVGSVVRVSTQPVRRLVKPAVTPAASSVPEPGEGYRLIDKAVDKPEPGDEYWNDRLKSWETRCFGVRDTSRFTSRDTYRRKLPAVPAPVVSVGDRVTVLTGPWAGCTGVVIALDAYVLLSDYGKMTAKYDSTPVVELDNVRVGGHKLILNKVTVEPLPPVVPEVVYRDLAIGETIRKGDEFWTFGFGPWTDAGPQEFGDKIGGYKARHRRPVRLQSPGWRYLDAGETVQSGDEVWSGLFNRYVPASADRGSVVTNEKLFRRKLPANQGG